MPGRRCSNLTIVMVFVIAHHDCSRSCQSDRLSCYRWFPRRPPIAVQRHWPHRRPTEPTRVTAADSGQHCVLLPCRQAYQSGQYTVL